jgi:hypothetical protein
MGRSTDGGPPARDPAGLFVVGNSRDSIEEIKMVAERDREW